MKNKRIFIAMPSSSRDVPLSVMSRINSLIVPKNYIIEFGYLEGVLIEDARCWISETFLDNGADYIFFVDSDVIIARNALKILLELDKDIVGLVCTSKRGNKFLTVFNETNRKAIEWKGTKKCLGIGMGCTLIKRKVIKELFEKWPNPFMPIVKEENGKFIKYGEDITMCQRAIELGFECWATDKTHAIHLGAPVGYYYQDGEYKITFNHYKDKL